MKQPIKKVNHRTILFILLCGICIGSMSTLAYDTYSTTPSIANIGPLRENDPAKPLIRPLLAYNNPETKTTNPLKKALQKSIDASITSGEATVISLYYRDLNTGHWFGINQDETFVPASLFKVPLMITYLKEAESDPSILSTKITNTLTEDQNKNEITKPLQFAGEGKVYTVEQLLQYMIEYSDNNATVLLFNHINQKTLAQVFSDLDIQVPNQGVNTDFISVNSYSLFFRVLYNATYLNHEMSEKGLELLSKIDFTDGIRKNIPHSVSVADKFGEYFLIQDGKTNEYQLHDCGIVYHKKSPYILCIMTKGKSVDTLKKVLQNISEMTYKSVDATQ